MFVALDKYNINLQHFNFQQQPRSRAATPKTKSQASTGRNMRENPVFLGSKNFDFCMPTILGEELEWLFPHHGGEFAHFGTSWRGICTLWQGFVHFGETRQGTARNIFD